MRRRLRIPAALVVAIVGVACDDYEGPQCRLFCVPGSPPLADAGPPPVVDASPVECPECSDEMGRCPAGCEAVG